jgi:ABC-type polysaccharide/polyol phosphate export permease
MLLRPTKEMRWSETRAVRDLVQVVTRSRTWRLLASADIRSRYRRTTLGPFWITITTGTMAVGIGVIYGQFFGQNVVSYLPYLTAGLIIWWFISSTLVEGANAFISASSLIKSSTLPIAFHVMRGVQKNMIVLLHNLLIIAAEWIFIRWPIGWSVFLSVLGIALMFVFLSAAGTVLAIVCVRYRDVPQMVQAVTQFLFFASPVIWYPESLRFGHLILYLNPVSHFLAVTRDPLLGRAVHLEDWALASAWTVASVVAAVALYIRYRDRIAYWT